MLTQLWKPWFVYQPGQLLRRGLLIIRPCPAGAQPLTTSWGASIVADPSRVVGLSIVTTGVYDLAVSEALLRLVDAGDTVIDAGGNIGYMSVLLSAGVGPGGTLLAFEPHPALFDLLCTNVRSVRAGSLERTELYRAALGAAAGTARLVVPPEFQDNDGLCSIATDAASSAPGFDVDVVTIDDTLGQRPVSLMKLDVEGHELQVLRGSVAALGEGRIRHIVFEDHDVAHSEVVRVLRGFGYEIFSLGWSMNGPKVAPLEGFTAAKPYEAPSYLATRASGDALARLAPRGWRVLRPVTGANCGGHS